MTWLNTNTILEKLFYVLRGRGETTFSTIALSGEIYIFSIFKSENKQSATFWDEIINLDLPENMKQVKGLKKKDIMLY